MTPKEQNLMIREQTDELVHYAKFKDILYDVRFTLSTSKIMATNSDILEETIMKEFVDVDEADGSPDNEIYIGDAGDILRGCKKLMLTPFQVHVVLGVGDPDENGIMEYAEFVPWAAEYIRNNFFFKPLCEK